MLFRIYVDMLVLDGQVSVMLFFVPAVFSKYDCHMSVSRELVSLYSCQGCLFT